MPASCPHCGRAIGGRDRFCDGCGAFLDWSTGGSADSQLPSRPDEQRAGVRLQLKTDLIRVTPGNAESTSFTVKNLGTQVEQFRFAVAGPDWITAEPAALSVYPGQEATGTVQAAPPRQPSSVAGVAPFRLNVTSAVHVGVSGSATGRADVAPYYELAAELVPTSSRGRGLTRHQITLDNRGNVPLRIALKPADVADGLRIGVPASADVPPGRVVEVPVSVYGSRRWTGRPEPKTFSLIAEGSKPLAATRLSGARIVLPLFPRWVPAATTGLIVAAAAATALVLMPGPPQHPIPPHSPTQTTVSPTTPTTPVSPTTPTTPVSPTTPNPPPPIDLYMENVTWTSSPSGLPAPVVQTTGCQAGTAVGSQGAVYRLPQFTLPDGTTAHALETDPPVAAESFSGKPTGSISGVYTFSSPTSQDETFSAMLGFCQEAQADATLQYQVIVEPSMQDPPPPQQIAYGGGTLTPIDADVPPGTTQITLRVLYTMDTNGVVWVDPQIAA